jgi:hypothetical protein
LKIRGHEIGREIRRQPDFQRPAEVAIVARARGTQPLIEQLATQVASQPSPYPFPGKAKRRYILCVGRAPDFGRFACNIRQLFRHYCAKPQVNAPHTSRFRSASSRQHLTRTGSAKPPVGTHKCLANAPDRFVPVPGEMFYAGSEESIKAVAGQKNEIFRLTRET